MIQWFPDKIYSGGQTGADLGGLVGAKRAGVHTGGWAAAGFRTEKGFQPVLGSVFGLQEHSDRNYNGRTKRNIMDADATLIISPLPKSSGTKLTLSLCDEFCSPYLLLTNFSDMNLRDIHVFLNRYQPIVLNVAGNRESKCPGLTRYTANLVYQIFNY